jgi:hypothetical protein
MAFDSVFSKCTIRPTKFEDACLQTFRQKPLTLPYRDRMESPYLLRDSVVRIFYGTMQ